MGLQLPHREAPVSSDPEVVIRQARRRQHRRWLLVGVLVVGAVLGTMLPLVLAGSGQQRPPGVPRSAAGGVSSAVPTGAKLISSRSINHSVLRIYASPSGLPIAKVDASYELFDLKGQLSSSGSGSVGASLLAPSGVVNEGGGSSEGPAGWLGICNCQVTNPAVALVRLISGHEVLDAMVPVTYDTVRFVVLAAINVPTLNPIVIQGLDSNGTILSSVPL